MSSERVQFGPFVLDADQYALTRAGKPVRLERIPMDLLLLLVREKGKLISREEIIERLWGKNLYFDTDNSINTAIRKIRNASATMPDIHSMSRPCWERVSLQGAMPSPLLVELAPIERARIMLAILPFENLSGDPGQDYFSDGLSEETIMRLGQMSPRQLGVIARTSSMAYKQTDKSVAQIGQELGVDYVLEGSVRRDGDRCGLRPS